MKNQNTTLHLLFIFSLILFACKKGDKSSLSHDGMTDLEAREYLAAYTQGMINETDVIEFRFVNTHNL